MIIFNLESETKGRGKRSSTNREVNPYDSRLFEKTVTLGCTQFQALMIPENVRWDLNKERAVIVESNNFPLKGDNLNVSFCC